MSAKQPLPVLISGAGLLARPWRNGAGVTREIMAANRPDGGLLWRLSLATIDSAAPFSTFAGIDLTFLTVAGAVRLDGAQAPFPVALGDTDAPLDFAGEIAVHGAPLEGQALALNLMVCRGKGSGVIVRHQGGMAAAEASVLLVFAPVAVTLGAGSQAFALSRHDTLVVAPGQQVRASGPCVCARVAVTPG